MAGAVFASESLEVPLGARLLVFSDGVYEISRPDRKMMEFSEFKAAASEAAFADNGLDLLAKWAIDIHISETFQDDYSMLRVCF